MCTLRHATLPADAASSLSSFAIPRAQALLRCYSPGPPIDWHSLNVHVRRKAPTKPPLSSAALCLSFTYYGAASRNHALARRVLAHAEREVRRRGAEYVSSTKGLNYSIDGHWHAVHAVAATCRIATPALLLLPRETLVRLPPGLKGFLVKYGAPAGCAARCSMPHTGESTRRQCSSTSRRTVQRDCARTIQ